MSLADALNRLDKRYAWSLFGFGLAVLFGLLSLYTEFIRDRRPQLRFEVISDASVLDVRERLGNLDILYVGVDIAKAHKSLRVIVLRVTNEGQTDILKTHYDDKAPLGFRVSRGTLLRAEVLSTSTPYLRQTLRVQAQIPDTAIFEPVILEANEWFTVKSLILHAEGTRPELEAIGKIAGVRSIRRVDSTGVVIEPGFFVRSFAGGLGIQATRLVVYFLGLIAALVAIVVPIVTVVGAISKRRRRRRVAQFKSITKLELGDRDEFVFRRYIENDIAYVLMLQRAAADERRISREASRYERRQRNHPDRVATAEPVFVSARGAPPPHWFDRGVLIGDMLGSGFVVKTENGWQVDPHVKQTLEEFVSFLEIRRAS